MKFFSKKNIDTSYNKNESSWNNTQNISKEWSAEGQFEPIEKPLRDQEGTFLFQVREDLLLNNSHADAMTKF